jgi:2-dehydro-3-deoxyphosphogluconate aldolase / (4S)-4-hydroxy-2-oxoglutarate aldolase
MKGIQTIQNIINEKIIAVIRTNTSEEAEKAAIAAYEGGIKVIELTMTTPNALSVIQKLKKYFNDEMVIGAGTVIDAVTARLAIECGANFIVSPHLDAEIIKMCNLYQVPVVPGTTNTKDIVEALKLGCGIIKLFPANLLGPKAIGSFKGPFPQANFIPTGGVNVESITDWLKGGALAVGTGSELIKEGLYTGDFSQITNYAKQLVEKVNLFKGEAL